MEFKQCFLYLSCLLLTFLVFHFVICGVHAALKAFADHRGGAFVDRVTGSKMSGHRDDAQESPR